MIHSYKFRIYPDDEQKRSIAINIGCNRWVWNYALAKRQEFWESVKDIPKEERPETPSAQYVISKDLTVLKKAEGTSWLNDADSKSFSNTLKDLDDAYVRFYKGLARPPKKKKKTYNGSYSTRKQSVKVDWENETNKSKIAQKVGRQRPDERQGHHIKRVF